MLIGVFKHGKKRVSRRDTVNVWTETRLQSASFESVFRGDELFLNMIPGDGLNVYVLLEQLS